MTLYAVSYRLLKDWKPEIEGSLRHECSSPRRQLLAGLGPEADWPVLGAAVQIAALLLPIPFQPSISSQVAPGSCKSV